MQTVQLRCVCGSLDCLHGSPDCTFVCDTCWRKENVRLYDNRAEPCVRSQRSVVHKEMYERKRYWGYRLTACTRYVPYGRASLSWKRVTCIQCLEHKKP